MNSSEVKYHPLILRFYFKMAGECELSKNIRSLHEKYFRNPKYNFFLSQDVL